MKLKFYLSLFFCLLCFLTYSQPTNYATLPYTNGFESRTLDNNWYTATSSATGRIRVHQGGILTWSGQTANAHTGSYFLGLDDSVGGSFHTQEAWLGVNLQGGQNVRLEFWWAEWNEEDHPEDGIFLSDNGGLTFTKVLDLFGTTQNDLVYGFYSLNIDSLATVHNLSYTNTFVIKFQQHDNYYFAGGNDGFLIDDLSVTGLNPACANDSIPPVAICQNLTVHLQPNGTDTVQAAQIDNGSSDNCFISTLQLSQSVFTCADIGMNQTVLSVTDGLGNTSVCNAQVMVMDTAGLTTLAIQLGSDSLICENTQLTLDAGQPGSSYNWSNGATSQTITVGGGSYHVQVTNPLGCTGADTVSLTEVIVPPVTLTPVGGSTVICTGQSVTIQADTGFSAYLWTTGTTNSSVTVSNGGNLFVTVTDVNGCTRIDSVEITAVNSAPPTAEILPASPVYNCAGGTVSLTASPGMNAYAWSDGATTPSINASAGFYSVTVTDANGCANGSDTTQVRDTTALAPTITVNGDTLCSSPGNSYSWMLNNVPTGDTTQCITGIASGDYSVIITNEFGCEADTTISFLVKMDELTATNWQVEVSPNPFSNLTRLSFTPPVTDRVQLEIFAVNGRKVSDVYAGEVLAGKLQQVEFKSDQLSEGLYFYRLSNPQGVLASGKLVLMR